MTHTTTTKETPHGTKECKRIHPNTWESFTSEPHLGNCEKCEHGPDGVECKLNKWCYAWAYPSKGDKCYYVEA